MNNSIRTGHFLSALDADAGAFNSSLPFDRRLWREDIRGSAAHAEMLAAQGILSSADADAIIAGLNAIAADIESGALSFDTDAEDIHMFIEAELTARIGDAGKRLHTARSRNDQVATDFRLYVKNAVSRVQSAIDGFSAILNTLSLSHSETIMPGYTHLQRAQPITLGYHLSAWREMLRRDSGRLADALARMDACPLGAGALAGTTYPIDRAMTAKSLGFGAVAKNTLDAVSDRDFVVESISAFALIMAHISRMAEEVILWSSAEFGFCRASDAFSTGSSIMPQKKNPDIAELSRGKTGRVYGNLISVLTTLKSLPLAYNKDLQEDKEPFFDAYDTVLSTLTVFSKMIAALTFDKAKMRAACESGHLNATDAADYLVSKGLPFRDAYKIVGAMTSETAAPIEKIPLAKLKEYSPLFEDDFYDAVSLENCVKRRGLQD